MTFSFNILPAAGPTFSAPQKLAGLQLDKKVSKKSRLHKNLFPVGLTF
jgi:hypothetical protein